MINIGWEAFQEEVRCDHRGIISCVRRRRACFCSVEGTLAWLEYSQVSTEKLQDQGLNRRQDSVTWMVEAVLTGAGANRVDHRRPGESEIRCLGKSSELVATTWTQGEELDARSTRQ